MITVGYGDFKALNEQEFLASIFMMSLACGVFADLIGSVSGYLS
jgi:hypothetical protein